MASHLAHSDVVKTSGNSLGSSSVNASSTAAVPLFHTLPLPVPDDIKESIHSLAAAGSIATEDDPFVVIKPNRAGLQYRMPTLTPAQQDATLAAVLTSPPVNLRNVPDTFGNASGMFFAGTISQCIAAMNQMVRTPWMRPVAGFPDVGLLWLVFGVNDIIGIVAPLNG